MDFPAVGPGTGRVCVTGTGCHRHGMCDQDGMCHRELLGTIHYSPASEVPLRKLEAISLRGSGLPVGREAISFVSSLRGHLPPCLRSHATDPTFPYAASQPNLYIDSAPSGDFPNSIDLYAYCKHTKFYNLPYLYCQEPLRKLRGK